MPRARAPSGASTSSSHSLSEHDPQELGTMYDYLAKIILLGPSGCGKSCLLHRFVRSEWRVLSSQTIGVEFSSKIIKVGTGSRRKRIKLQLWDTAGQERFRSVTRSYYRGAAGALLIYDITRRPTFNSLPTFLSDARALASDGLTLLLVGNKSDLSTPPNSRPSTPTQSNFAHAAVTTATPSTTNTTTALPTGIAVTRRHNTQGSNTPSSASTRSSYADSSSAASFSSDATIGGTNNPWRDFHSSMSRAQTLSPDAQHHHDVAREVPTDEAARWASGVGIPVAMETSALNGENVDEVFERLARLILTRIELGEVDPDDPNSGVSYGGGGWTVAGPSTAASRLRRKKSGLSGVHIGWEGVFPRQTSRGCCR